MSVSWVCLLLGLLIRTTLAANSSVCMAFGPTDALLLFDPQNCFIEQRSFHSGEASYTIPARFLTGDGASITAGPIPIDGSGSIVALMNDWLVYVASNAGTDGNATVFATMDYHPPLHCSFCNANTGGIAAGTFCLRGADTVDAFNGSHRCKDEISDEDFTNNEYYQWPFHCTAGEFGARFDPYLRLPADAVVIKLGTDRGADDYSALRGGRLSTAAAGTHDTVSSSLGELAEADDLRSEMTRLGIKRVIAMGLASDYVVKQTLHDAMGTGRYGTTYQPPGLQNGTVAVVDAATKGVSSFQHMMFMTNVEATSNGVGLYARTAIGGMVELCADSCDTRADCDDPAAEYCQALDNFGWGECQACPSASGSVCKGRGTCTDLGACECDFMYHGTVCSDVSRLGIRNALAPLPGCGLRDRVCLGSPRTGPEGSCLLGIPADRA